MMSLLQLFKCANVNIGSEKECNRFSNVVPLN